MRYLFFIFILIVFTSCQSNQSEKELPKDVLSEKFLAEYQGITPCANCSGINMRVSIKPQRQYEIRMKYLGKDDSIYQYQGKYHYDKSSKKLKMKIGKFTKYFKVHPEYLEILNKKGKPIKSAIKEDYYKLTKQ